MANQNTELETNLFEELSDADLMAVVGGTGGGITVTESDPAGSTTVSANKGLTEITVSNTQVIPNLGTQTVTITR